MYGICAPNRKVAKAGSRVDKPGEGCLALTHELLPRRVASRLSDGGSVELRHAHVAAHGMGSFHGWWWSVLWSTASVGRAVCLGRVVCC